MPEIMLDELLSSLLSVMYGHIDIVKYSTFIPRISLRSILGNEVTFSILLYYLMLFTL